MIDLHQILTPDCIKRVTTIADNPTIEPTERSIPLMMITMVIPTAMIPTIVVCRAKLVKFLGVKKASFHRLKISIKTLC